MWTTLKISIEFVTILLLFLVLVFWPQGTCELSFLTRDWTIPPPLEGKVLTLDHLEVPKNCLGRDISNLLISFFTNKIQTGEVIPNQELSNRAFRIKYIWVSPLEILTLQDLSICNLEKLDRSLMKAPAENQLWRQINFQLKVKF